ncbi:MAG TPA: hypothetical protein VMD04_03150, partial [Candidatus Margulisiibacteriota bacterium]|nr:hypothetical protein [Candidatus Margulisiibacteriota bacterium]
MSYFNLVILVIGSGGLLAQLLLLRQLFVVYAGNEMTLGILLANWILAEGAGVFIFGRLIDTIRDKLKLFLRLQLIFSVLLPVSVILARDLKYVAGLSFGETIGLSTTFFSSLFLLFPIACIHGALFSCAAKLYPVKRGDTVNSLGVVYAWETIGSVMGGLALTYIFIPYFDPLEAAFLVSIASLAVSFPLQKKVPYGRLKSITLVLVFLFLYLFSSGSLRRIKELSLKIQYPGLTLLEEKNSVYGNIAVTSKAGQYTFFYNGTPM